MEVRVQTAHNIWFLAHPNKIHSGLKSKNTQNPCSQTGGWDPLGGLSKLPRGPISLFTFMEIYIYIYAPPHMHTLKQNGAIINKLKDVE